MTEFVSGLEVTEILDEKSEIVRGMGIFFNAKIIPKEVATAVLHVYSMRIDGNYTANIMNQGVFPLIGTSVTQTLTEETTSVSLLDNVVQGVGWLRREASKTIKTSWYIKGILKILWALINIFLVGSCTCRLVAEINALGFSKNVSILAKIPVRNVKVEYN